MASHFARRKDRLLFVSIVGVLLLVQAGRTAVAEGPDASNQFEWSAELVSFDQASGMATLKARLDARADEAVLGELSEGDPITITWTGLTWGAGIGAIGRRGSSESESEGRLDMPAEFVGTEMDNAYVLFRVPVPQGSASKLQSLQSGDWVTATTSHDATRLEQPISTIRPYNDVS